MNVGNTNTLERDILEHRNKFDEYFSGKYNVNLFLQGDMPACCESDAGIADLARFYRRRML